MGCGLQGHEFVGGMLVCECGKMTAREYAMRAKELYPPITIVREFVPYSDARDCVRKLLEYVGEDPSREGLKETPDRVLKAYNDMLSGYKEDPAKVIKTFEDGAVNYDEMIISKDIEFYSFCAHHWIPFFGKAHIAYIPDGRVIGLSKLSRILDIYSKRLQIQEQLTVQITAALDEHLKPKGSACVITAQHLCCMARGVGKQSSSMVTSSLTGVFRKPEVRQEFLGLIK